MTAAPVHSLLSQWLYCLLQYLRISLFRSAPSNLPYSHACILLTVLAYSLVGFLLLHNQRSLPSILAQVVVEVLILYAISYAMLRFSHKLERLVQTLSALIGVNLIVGIVGLPNMHLLPEVQPDEPIDPLVLQLNLLLLFWNLAVISLVFKRSFDIRTLTAGFLSFNYFLLYELLLLTLFA